MATQKTKYNIFAYLNEKNEIDSLQISAAFQDRSTYIKRKDGQYKVSDQISESERINGSDMPVDHLKPASACEAYTAAALRLHELAAEDIQELDISYFTKDGQMNLYLKGKDGISGRVPGPIPHTQLGEHFQSASAIPDGLALLTRLVYDQLAQFPIEERRIAQQDHRETDMSALRDTTLEFFKNSPHLLKYTGGSHPDASRLLIRLDGTDKENGVVRKDLPRALRFRYDFSKADSVTVQGEDAVILGKAFQQAGVNFPGSSDLRDAGISR